MLLAEHPRGQGLGGVARQYGHHSLGQNRAMVQLWRYVVHRGTSELATRLNGAAVGVQARKGG